MTSRYNPPYYQKRGSKKPPKVKQDIDFDDSFGAFEASPEVNKKASSELDKKETVMPLRSGIGTKSLGSKAVSAIMGKSVSVEELI